MSPRNEKNSLICADELKQTKANSTKQKCWKRKIFVFSNERKVFDEASTDTTLYCSDAARFMMLESYLWINKWKFFRDLRINFEIKPENSMENKQNLSWICTIFLLPIRQRPHAFHPRTHFANWCLVESKREAETRFNWNSLEAFLRCMCCGLGLSSLSNWLGGKQKLADSPRNSCYRRMNEWRWTHDAYKFILRLSIE